MLKFSHRTLILIAGLVWLGVGIFLMTLGMRFIKTDLQMLPATSNLIDFFGRFTQGREQGAMILILLALLVGYLKGKTVLTKAAKKQIARILQLKAPIPLQKIYSPAYYFLLGGMMCLGILMKILPLSIATRGAIDLAIGAALIQGSIHYFRFRKVA